MECTLELGNRISELVSTLDRLESVLREEGITGQTVVEIRLVAEEALSNIIRYAYRSDEEQRIRVTLTCSRDEVRLELRDGGRPFNPVDMPAPDLDAPLEARSIGGLGVHLMRTLTDEVTYARREGCNILTLTRRL